MLNWDWRTASIRLWAVVVGKHQEVNSRKFFFFFLSFRHPALKYPQSNFILTNSFVRHLHIFNWTTHAKNFYASAKSFSHIGQIRLFKCIGNALSDNMPWPVDKTSHILNKCPFMVIHLCHTFLNIFMVFSIVLVIISNYVMYSIMLCNFSIQLNLLRKVE